MISLLARILWVFVIIIFTVVVGIVYLLFSTDEDELKGYVRKMMDYISDVLRLRV